MVKAIRQAIDRVWYEVRWWRWFHSCQNVVPLWMYIHPTRLDDESRRIVRERITDEWMAREPTFHGTHPARERMVKKLNGKEDQ